MTENPYPCYHVANTTNITANPWKYIECLQGPQMQEFEIAVTISVINVFVFITGLIGNVLVCIVIVKHPALNSPTDYFLLNLALSDLTLLIFGLPYDILLYWYQYPWIFGVYACQARALIAEMASYVSVLTVVAFSTERYLAICHPLHKFALSKAQRCLKVIMILWIISFICALPFAFDSDVHYLTYPVSSDHIIKESAVCAMVAQPEGIPLAEISSIVFFIIPLIMIIYQYVNMGIVIHKITRNNDSFGNGGDGSVHGKRRRMIQSKNIIKMLSFVVLGFFGCWFPFHIQRLSSIHLTDYPHFDHLNYWLYLVTGVFYYLSSTLNPILYNVMSDRMRNAFKDILCGRKPRQPYGPKGFHGRNNSYGSEKLLVNETNRFNKFNEKRANRNKDTCENRRKSPSVHETQKLIQPKEEVVKICRHTIEFNIMEVTLKK